MARDLRSQEEGRTRAAIVDSARHLFSRYGHNKTSVEEIAREAGLSKATVYNHFKGKEQIIAEVIDSERRMLIGRLRRAVESAPEPLEALRTFFRTRLREIQRLHSTYRAGREEIIRFMPHVARAIEESRKEEQLILTEILRRGAGEGVFRQLGDFTLAADILFRTVLSITFPLFGQSDRSAALRLEGLIDMVLTGICTDTVRGELLKKEDS